jgi:hypothetical protein
MSGGAASLICVGSLGTAPAESWATFDLANQTAWDASGETVRGKVASTR